VRTAPELISVIIPVRNAAAHLGEQLEALAGQTYRGRWEVLIVDNGSTDSSLDVVARWRERLPGLRVADASARAGLNHARNVGAAAARGDFFAFCDADDVVTPGWLEALAESAPFADIVGGVADAKKLNGAAAIPSRYTGEKLGGLRLQHDFLHSVSGGNCGMWASVAHGLGWDETFAYASSDIEFCWRAGLGAYRLAVAPNALIHARQRAGYRALARQWWLYGQSDAHLFSRFGAAGMPRASMTDVLGRWAWLVVHLPYLARSRRQRRIWVARAAHAVARILGSIRYRVFFP
jgi:glycosyltransferase involved in cell wall biosynthesis